MSAGIPFVEYLYQAVATNHGLVLRSSDPAYVIRKLKEAKLVSLDTSLECLSIIPSISTEGEIWIVKNAEPSA